MIEEKIKSFFPVEDIKLLYYTFTKAKNIILTIGKVGGITVKDCEKISMLLKEEIPDDCSLQVQSPGIGWEIQIEDVGLFIDQKVRVKYSTDTKNKKLDGDLKGIENDRLVLEKNKKKIVIDLDKIQIIKTTL